jgi:hypothetical protein
VQRLVLIHRDESEPMVLQTSGYSIFSIGQSTITSMFRTNQIQVEHRFFRESGPAKKDWLKLDIKQSADDFHAVTVALKQIYQKRWVNTGASKGGMTSVYHRRFYPNDLDGTLADVAPLSFSNEDHRYSAFVEKIGGDTYKQCRENFKTIQTKLLEDRKNFVPNIKGTFNQLGSADVGFEQNVLEALFIFFQYTPVDSSDGCNGIPVKGSTEEMYEFLQNANSISDYSDEGMDEFIPYFFQSAYQLDWPLNISVNELMNDRVFRIFYLLRGPHLQKLALIKHCDPVGNAENTFHVMRDNHRR